LPLASQGISTAALCFSFVEAILQTSAMRRDAAVPDQMLSRKANRKATPEGTKKRNNNQLRFLPPKEYRGAVYQR
jgi:hypothetical protein